MDNAMEHLTVASMYSLFAWTSAMWS
jgi:hypothetical protein